MLKHTLLAAAFAPLVLAGCSGTKNRGLESVHQPVVTRADYVFDVNAGPRGVAPGERQRLVGWLDGLHLSYGDNVAIDDPANDRTAARADVAEAVSRYGVILSSDAPVTAVPVTPGTMRVVVSRSRASVPGCPDWSRARGTDFENNTTSNYGCGINSNLAAMVANPNDLVRGQTGSGVYDTATGTRAISTYRKAAPTGGGGTVVKSETTGGR